VELSTTLLLVGGVVEFLLLCAAALWLGRRIGVRRMRRRLEKARPPKGTRPVVILVHDEVEYDLTDSLLRVHDRDGKAVWVVQGPLHLRFTDGIKLDLRLGNPVPHDTELKLDLISSPGEITGRFRTFDELVDEYPELAAGTPH
jgi:hypothetical protein